MTVLAFQELISTISGPESMAVALVVLALVLYFKKYKIKSLQIFFSSVAAVLVTYGIKYALKIPRPEGMLVAETGYRFPSGHATMAGVVTALGMYYAYTHIKNRYVRFALYTLSLAWFALVSYSRLYLQVHVLVDVVVGGLIGALSVIFFAYLFGHSKHSKLFVKNG